MDLSHLLIALIAATPPTLAAVLAYLKASKDLDKTHAVGQDVQQVHLSLNGRLDQLLDAVKSAAYAQGLTDGKSLGRAEAMATRREAAAAVHHDPQPETVSADSAPSAPAVEAS